MGTDLLPVGIGPDRVAQGGTSPLLDNLTELVVAGAAEDELFALAAGLGDRTGTGDGLKGGRRGEATAVIAKLGQQGRGEERAGSRQRR